MKAYEVKYGTKVKVVDKEVAIPPEAMPVLVAGFTLDKIIDTVDRLIEAAEDGCFQYGCDADTDECVIDGRNLLKALKDYT